MFKRAPKLKVDLAAVGMQVSGPKQPATEIELTQRILGEFLASTALSRVQSDIGAIARDFSDFKDNIARLNTELGVFREKVIVPVKDELQYIRYNLGARSDDTVGSLQKLVHHLEGQLELLLKARGINPQARDAAGETPLDRMGVSPGRPDYQTLELEGVQFVESGNAQADEASMLRTQNAKLMDRLTVQARTIAELQTGQNAPHGPESFDKPGDAWIDGRRRVWILQPTRT
jgi:hypothetical protein